MTTEEFIQKVNALSEEERRGLVAHLMYDGKPAITDLSRHFTLAYLPEHTKKWVFAADSYSIHSIPGSVLKLMGELAESNEKKYVILNGKPRGKRWYVFGINKRYQKLDECPGIDRDDLISNMSYTESELAEAKKYLPEALQKAVDLLTVPLKEALKMEAKTMNDLITLAENLGDLIDVMPEFDADFIYYTWEDSGETYKLWFELHTGKWSSSDATRKVFSFRSGLAAVFANDLMNQMTKIVEEDNDD